MRHAVMVVVMLGGYAWCIQSWRNKAAVICCPYTTKVSKFLQINLYAFIRSDSNGSHVVLTGRRINRTCLAGAPIFPTSTFPNAIVIPVLDPTAGTPYLIGPNNNVIPQAIDGGLTPQTSGWLSIPLQDPTRQNPTIVVTQVLTGAHTFCICICCWQTKAEEQDFIVTCMHACMHTSCLPGLKHHISCLVPAGHGKTL